MRRYISSFLFIVLPIMFFAQSNTQEEYENFRQVASKNYTDFRATAIKNYVEFLVKSWEWYSAGQKKEIPKEEPLPPIVYKEEKRKQDDEEILYKEVIPEPVLTPAPEPSPILPIKDKVKEIGYIDVNVEFYGTLITVRYPKNGQFKLKSNDGGSLAEIWEIVASEEFDATIYDCLNAREHLKLCDYAYLLLVRQLASKAVGNGSESTLLSAYIYAVSGYQMRLATSRSGKLHMLYGSNYQIYNANYYEIDGSYYYPIDCDESSLQICSASFENECPLSLAINEEQKFAINTSTLRHLKSDIGVSAASIVNKNLISFYNDYPAAMISDDPCSRWALYANTPFSQVTKDVLYSSLKPAIAGKSQIESLNILLNFVQTVFAYEYDDKVWGEDRAFFAEETLYYPYADCEDRSILFSRLVRDLMGLDVVLLYYPGHMATAVNTNCNGEYLMIDGKKYIICDPTYINAPVGATMPEMNNKVAKVIRLKK